jgi:hypothetical protein
MKQLKRSFIILALLFYSLTPAPAIDFGLVVDNMATLSQETVFAGTYMGKATPWITYESEDVTFSMQGIYIYTIEIPYYVDLDHLILDYHVPFYGDYASLFSIKAGRFIVSDFSGFVLNHKLDGMQIAYSNAVTDISFFAGYAGLLLKPYSTIQLTKEDISDTSDSDVFFAPPRFIGMLQIAFPELFPKHTLTTSFLAQIDLRTEGLEDEGVATYDAATGGYLHTMYTGLGFSGAIGSTFFYDIFGYVNTGGTLSFIGDVATIGLYQYKPILSFFTGGAMRFYFEDFLQSRLTISALIASGDEDYIDYYEGNTDGEAHQFIPIAHLPVALVFTPDLSNIVLCELSFSMKPFSGLKGAFMQNFQTVLKTLLFLRSSMGPISEAGLNQESDSYYLGAEIDGIINMRILSDMGCALSIGCFIPDNASGAAFDGSREIELLCKLELSLGL